MASKALIVDDEDAIVDLVRYHLEKEGMQCWQASEGSAALELARAHKPDLMILDLMLPGIDGLETLERMRQAGDDSPVIMISGHGNIDGFPLQSER